MLWEPPSPAVFVDSRNDSAFQRRGSLTTCHQAGEREVDDLNSRFRHLEVRPSNGPFITVLDVVVEIYKHRSRFSPKNVFNGLARNEGGYCVVELYDYLLSLVLSLFSGSVPPIPFSARLNAPFSLD